MNLLTNRVSIVEIRWRWINRSKTLRQSSSKVKSRWQFFLIIAALYIMNFFQVSSQIVADIYYLNVVKSMKAIKLRDLIEYLYLMARASITHGILILNRADLLLVDDLRIKFQNRSPHNGRTHGQNTLKYYTSNTLTSQIFI